MSEINVSAPPLPEGPSAYERLVDVDIEEFDKFFQSLGNQPIVRGEKAIIKTYLAYKLGLVKK